MKRRRCLYFFLMLMLAVAAAIGKERVWTSADGRTMRGEFVRELDGEVTFLVGGKLQTVPLARLSERDQQIVRDLAAGKPVPDDPAPPAADDPFTGPPVTTAPPAGDTPAAAAVDSPDRAPGERPPPLINKPKPPVSRVWTDNQGRLTTGKFVRVFNGKVVLTRAGGPISIPFFDLSEADQQYVRDLLTAQDQEELIPVRPGADDSTGLAASPSPAPQPSRPARGPGGLGPGRGPGSIGPPESRLGPGSTLGSGPPADPGGFGPGGYGPGSYGPPGSGLNTGPEPPAPIETYTEPAATTSYDYSPPASPPPATRRVPLCSSCQARLTETEAQGTSCPHCGARWSFNQYASTGSNTSAAATSTSSRTTPRSRTVWEEFAPETKRAVIGGTVVVVVLAVLAALVVGVIAVVMSIASATRSGRQYRDI